MRSRDPWRPAWVFAGFGLLSLFSTWPLLWNLGSALPSDLGDPLLSAWILGWDADRLRHGLRGVWDAPIFFPNLRTLAFSEHLFGIAVPLAPIVWLTHNPLVAYNVAFILSYVLAAVGMFLLAQLITGSTGAAVLAALAFAFGPARADRISHVQGLLADGDCPSIDLAFPAANAPLRTITLKQTGTTRIWHWSVHEIVVLGPGAPPKAGGRATDADR